MKILLFIFTLVFSFTSNAQVDFLTSTQWRLTGLHKDSQNINVPASNFEVDKILLIMSQGDENAPSDFSTIVCDELSSGDGIVNYDDTNNTFILPDLTQTLGGCTQGENGVIQLAYFSFYYDNLNIPLVFQITKLSGVYVLEVIAPNGDIASYQEDLLGIKKVQVTTFTLYPNPVTNNVTIKTEEAIELINIYSVTGKKIATYSTTSINTSLLMSGIYFIEVHSNGKKSVQKFVKL